MLLILDVANNSMSNNALAPISDYISQIYICNTTLTELAVSFDKSRIVLGITKIVEIHRHFKGNKAKLLAAFLLKNAVVEKLTLSQSCISDVGCIALSEYLMFDSVLQELNISNNSIGSRGIKKKLNSKAVLDNKSLKKLDISLNNIFDDGAV